MNMLHIIGNLTADPQCRTVNTTNGQSTVCDLSIATNRVVNGKKVAEYFRATLWNTQADNAVKYLSKGRKVAVTGPVEGRAYMGNDGQPRVSLEIRRVMEIEYLGGGREAGTEPATTQPASEEYIPVTEDDLPF